VIAFGILSNYVIKKVLQEQIHLAANEANSRAQVEIVSIGRIHPGKTPMATLAMNFTI